MRKIHLHGVLSKYGDCHEIEVLTAGEAIAALCANFPEIERDIRTGNWVVLRGDPDTGICLDEEAVAGMRLGDADLHIMPEVVGAKNSNGILKAVIGVALIAVSFGSAAFLANPISGALLGATTYGNAIGQIGLAMALAGVSTMLAPEQDAGGADENKSYTLTGPVSQYGQGHALQVIYGEVITGAMLISGGIDANGMKLVTETKPEEEKDPFAIEADEESWNKGP
jgi:predicted phage tail protein